MPRWLSPIFPVQTITAQSELDVAESIRRLRVATEPPHFSSIVRPAVVGVWRDDAT
jgi:hypothetical protein